MIEYEYKVLSEAADPWSNCVIKMIARCDGREGLDYMPGNFKDAAEFEASELYQQMRQDATGDLMRLLPRKVEI